MTNSISIRPLTSIKRRDRHRRDYGDLDALARSIDENGLLQPIAITPDGVLIAGERRLLAWPKTRFRDEPIPVHVVPLDEIAPGEWAENVHRKDFTPSEAVAIRRALEPGLKAKARERQGARTDLRGNSQDVAPCRAADQAARLVGKDRRTLDRAEAIVAAAEAEPEKYGRLVDDMDRTGRVNGPYKRLQVMQQSEALRASPPPLPMRGPYPCIVVDFPWPHEPDEDDPGGRGRALRPYPTMSIAEGRALPLESILAEDAVMWIWATNFHMRYAYELLDAWGMTSAPTILTWVKDKMGRGQVLRDKTEHCIVATRGRPSFRLTNETTELRAPRREHSRKPDEFYRLVESLCPASIYAELFSRGGLGPNWDCHGDEIGKFATARQDQLEQIRTNAGARI
jgi:N6-adenosine-specific RNA methylase IME4/ParB-like chromosome segregation protein Spo0J